MILTGPEITSASKDGRLRISPFTATQINPNSYNVRLGGTLLTYTDQVLDTHRPNPTRRTEIGDDGHVLQPGELHLGHTLERTGSESYAQLLNGDRTTGSLGIWVHVSAPLGHQGHAIRWTLEIRATRPVRVRPGMAFGKLVFLRTHGSPASYQQHGLKYRASEGIETSRLYEENPGGRR
ncbi:MULTISPECIES: dCTP deaminase domain-containing protein [unclassified Streptomyces]|uniref:dCTP deaminase n=1 Tax=unclassified Streptomyces TaxID=2593676 RepID=UPI00381853CA